MGYDRKLFKFSFNVLLRRVSKEFISYVKMRQHYHFVELYTLKYWSRLLVLLLDTVNRTVFNLVAYVPLGY